jgi:hypothetical protein
MEVMFTKFLREKIFKRRRVNLSGGRVHFCKKRDFAKPAIPLNLFVKKFSSRQRKLIL